MERVCFPKIGREETEQELRGKKDIEERICEYKPREEIVSKIRCPIFKFFLVIVKMNLGKLLTLETGGFVEGEPQNNIGLILKTQLGYMEFEGSKWL